MEKNIYAIALTSLILCFFIVSCAIQPETSEVPETSAISETSEISEASEEAPETSEPPETSVPTNTPNVLDIQQELLIINCFEDTWSVTEDGSDWVQAVEFGKDTDIFQVVTGFISNLPLTEVDNPGNFTPDFSLSGGTTEDGSYDFIFYESDLLLVVRLSDGSCKKVEISETDFFELKEYIGEMRLGIALGELDVA